LKIDCQQLNDPFTGFIEKTSGEVVYMISPNIDTPHAFTTRFGGVSSGIYGSLNLAQRAGDDLDNVRENYDRLCKALDISVDDIVCSNQVHGTHIRVATRDDRGGLFVAGQGSGVNPNQADGILTQTPGVAPMVFTADCVPILLYDSVNNVAGAVHAGWRSTVSDIAGTAVRKMVSEFGCQAADIKAAIGPCISKCCFETDADVADAMRDAMPDTADTCFVQCNEKYMVDLKAANRIFLENAGVTDIVISNECTSCSSDKYWSHRKTGGQRGSQAAVIAIRD